MAFKTIILISTEPPRGLAFLELGFQSAELIFFEQLHLPQEPSFFKKENMFIICIPHEIKSNCLKFPVITIERCSMSLPQIRVIFFFHYNAYCSWQEKMLLCIFSLPSRIFIFFLKMSYLQGPNRIYAISICFLVLIGVYVKRDFTFSPELLYCLTAHKQCSSK